MALLTYFGDVPHRRALEGFAEAVTLPGTSTAAAASATKDLARVIGEHATLDAQATAAQFGSITRFVDATGHTFTGEEKYIVPAVRFVAKYKFLLLLLWVMGTLLLLYYWFFM